MEPVVEISFACLPLRSVGRLDVPLDASPVYRARYENLVAAVDQYDLERTYFLYDAHCVFRLANSEVENILRFEFEGIVRTDASDLLTESAELRVTLASETCGGVPEAIFEWFKGRIEKAVIVEFDRFIAAGQLEDRAAKLGQVERLSDVAGFSGMDV